MNPIPEYPAMSTFCYLCAHVNAIHERGVHSTNTPAQKRVAFIFLTPCAAARRRARASTGRPRSWCIMDAVSVRSSSVRAAAQKRRRAVSCGPTDPMPPVCHRPTRGAGRRARLHPLSRAFFLSSWFLPVEPARSASTWSAAVIPYSARWAYSSISDECPSCAHFPRETWVAHYLASR